jgi:hypothetical protein
MNAKFVDKSVFYYNFNMLIIDYCCCKHTGSAVHDLLSLICNFQNALLSTNNPQFMLVSIINHE